VADTPEERRAGELMVSAVLGMVGTAIGAAGDYLLDFRALLIDLALAVCDNAVDDD
jgi:hypothetical protein